MNESELSLIRAWQQGEDQAIWAIFNQYYPKAVNVALLSGLTLEEAQDHAQESFLHAFECRHQLRDPAAFPLWFYRITTSRLLDAIKSKQHLREVSLENVKELIETSVDHQATTPDEIMILAERREQLWGRVQKLSPHYRIPLVLRYYGDFSLHEIATLIGKREGTVRVIIHRALQQLRILAKDMEPQDEHDHSSSHYSKVVSQADGG